MVTKLKVVDDLGDISAAAPPPAFDPAPTRNRNAGWTAERQRIFIDVLSLTGSVGEASAAAGVSSRSAYRLRNRAGGAGFARAWDIARQISVTGPTARGLDRAIDGCAKRFQSDGEQVMERNQPSDRLLLWLLAHLDPVQFGGTLRQARPRSVNQRG